MAGTGLREAEGVSRVVYAETFTGTDGDKYGHGTHVAGIAASNGHSSNGMYKGIAPAAHLVSLKVPDSDSVGQDNTVIAALQRAIELKAQYNIRVLNLSLRRPVEESYLVDPLCQAAEAAWKAGIVVVVAAGNYGRDNTAGTEGYATIASPANDPYVITAGAMKTMGTPVARRRFDRQLQLRGTHPAGSRGEAGPGGPGNWMISTLGRSTALYGNDVANPVPTASYNTQTNSSAWSSSYYSMAAPVVSGAAALLLQKEPALTPDQVKARLMLTAGKTVSIAQHCRRSGDRRDVPEPVRHLHGGRGLPGRSGGAGEQRSGHRLGDVSHRLLRQRHRHGVPGG